MHLRTHCLTLLLVHIQQPLLLALYSKEETKTQMRKIYQTPSESFIRSQTFKIIIIIISQKACEMLYSNALPLQILSLC